MSYYAPSLATTDDSDANYLHTPVDTPYYCAIISSTPDDTCNWPPIGTMPYGASPKITSGGSAYTGELPHYGQHLMSVEDQPSSCVEANVVRSPFDNGSGHQGYPYHLDEDAVEGYSHDEYYPESGYGDSRSGDLQAHATAARLGGSSYLNSSRHALAQTSTSNYAHDHGARHPSAALPPAKFNAHSDVPGPAFVGHPQYGSASHHYTEEFQYPDVDARGSVSPSRVSGGPVYALDDVHTPELIPEEPGPVVEVMQQPHATVTLPQRHEYHTDPYAPRLRVDTEHLATSQAFHTYSSHSPMDYDGPYGDSHTYQYILNNGSPGMSSYAQQHLTEKLHVSRNPSSGVSYIDAPRPLHAPRQLQAYGNYYDGTMRAPSLVHPCHRIIGIPVAEPPPPSSPPRHSVSIEDQPKRPLTVACHFCRRRKITCVSPPPGSKERTCGQCAKRGQECTYPTKSRRGIRQKAKTDDLGQQQAVDPEQAQAGGSPPGVPQAYAQVSHNETLHTIRPMPSPTARAAQSYP
ncbi:hypothetical protein CERSUDRAFT_119594 [Gelatoporia subvermispora B]|uniref:Zn(2)-C6 fungal-type domain-containing protein n=1 Tax=Ceriporiopsis subvermispora (strain B) TaxID=914234 RepID=M2Q4K1_CERS8|nr:hypothetical protein CERSUDRAFT_119594 [Gelatoporia subvermispora B]